MELVQKITTKRVCIHLFQYVLEDNSIDWRQLAKDANHRAIIIEVGAACTYFELDRYTSNFDEDVYSLAVTCLDIIRNMLMILPTEVGVCSESVNRAKAVLDHGAFLCNVQISKELLAEIDDRKSLIIRQLTNECVGDVHNYKCNTAEEFYLQLPTDGVFNIKINDNAVLRVEVSDKTIRGRLQMIRDLLEALCYFKSELDWLTPGGLFQLCQTVELLEQSRGMFKPAIIGLFNKQLEETN